LKLTFCKHKSLNQINASYRSTRIPDQKITINSNASQSEARDKDATSLKRKKIEFIVDTVTWKTPISLQNTAGKTQSLVKMLTAVIGKDVRDMKISLIAKLHMNTERTEDRVT
jgi:hypothetical protein